MSRWKKFNKSNFQFTPTQYHKTQNLDSSSADVQVYQFISGSVTSSRNISILNSTGSIYTLLENLFYLSSSKDTLALEDGAEKSKFSNNQHSLCYRYQLQPQHKIKFFDSGSVLSIPRKYYNESIKRTSFKLTDNSHSSGSVIIQDDGYGNLYPVNNTISQSTNSPSSSDNYVGNIFYELGLVILTNTGSYTSDITYLDTLTGNFKFNFKSSKTIFTREYVVTINPSEFNYTWNPTVRGFYTGSDEVNIKNSPHLLPEFTQSFNPYATSILLFDNNTSGPIAVGKLSQPVQMVDNMPISFKLKLDM